MWMDFVFFTKSINAIYKQTWNIYHMCWVRMSNRVCTWNSDMLLFALANAVQHLRMQCILCKAFKFIQRIISCTAQHSTDSIGPLNQSAPIISHEMIFRISVQGVSFRSNHMLCSQEKHSHTKKRVISTSCAQFIEQWLFITFAETHFDNFKI